MMLAANAVDWSNVAQLIGTSLAAFFSGILAMKKRQQRARPTGRANDARIERIETMQREMLRILVQMAQAQGDVDLGADALRLLTEHKQGETP